MQLAIIGFGVSAKTNHLPVIAASDRFALAAIVDPIAEPPDPAVKAFDSVDALRRSGLQIDAVALCTPPSDRLAFIAECIDTGWHMLLEKPPVANADDLVALRALANPRGRTLFASWHSCENPAVDAAAAWLKRRPVDQLELRWLEHVDDWHPNQNWLWREHGFGVFDAGINAFSILLHILPGALSITETKLFVPKNAATPAAAQLQFALENKPVGQASLDLLHPGTPVWEISILSGRSELLLQDGGKRLSIDGQAVSIEGPGEYDRVYDKFASLIDGCQSSLETRPLELVLDALSQGKVVAAPPIDFEQV